MTTRLDTDMLRAPDVHKRLGRCEGILHSVVPALRVLADPESTEGDLYVARIEARIALAMIEGTEPPV